MNLLRSQARISELLAIFVAQVKAYGAVQRTDINRVAETVLIPLFREVYGLLHLEDLNRAHGANFAGLDLGDRVARVGVQVTSTPTADKVKHTLQQVVGRELYRDYDRVIVYVLTEKQKSYPAAALSKIVGGRFDFDPKRDVLDYRDLVKEISGLTPEKTWRVEQLLEEHFGLPGPPFWTVGSSLPPESVYLNLLEIFFPEKLYVAKVGVDRSEVIENSQGRSLQLNQKCGARDVIRAALEQRGLRFGLDWEVSSGQIITFHDLTDGDCPLAQVVDAGTADTLEPRHFYGKNEDYERVFKSLLRRCLQQKLYRQYVQWQHKEKMYVFTGYDGEAAREEQWHGQKKARRTVFERTPQRDDPQKTWYCKHLAFQTQIYQFGAGWYLLLKPEWFFSRDGYERYKYADDKVSWLKRREWNGHVFNHLKFITYFLKAEKDPGLFERNDVYPFLKFGRLASFSNSPGLDDAEWLNREDKEDRQRLEVEGGLLPLPF